MNTSPADAAPKGAPSTAKTERLRALAESTAVSELMSKSVVCLAPEARVDSVIDMFLARGISSAPVLDENWRPTGMVSKTDLLRVISEEGGMAQAPAEARPGVPTPADAGEGYSQVRDIVSPHVLSLHEEAPVSVAAALMAYEGVHRLPIVASSGEVVGVISTLDIIRWVARCTDLDVPGTAAAT